MSWTKKIGFGKYSEKSLIEIFDTDPQYACWILNKRLVSPINGNTNKKSIGQRDERMENVINGLKNKEVGDGV